MARLELVPALRDLRDEVAAAESAVNRRVSEATPVAALQAQLGPRLAEDLAAARDALQKANTRHAAAATSVTAATDTTRKQQTERDAVSRRIQQNSGRVQILRTAWQTLANDRPWTDNVRATVAAELRAGFETHQAVEQVLARAHALLRDQAATQELENLQKERMPLVAERDRLTRYAEAALAIK